jgi:osmotically-inducible protein OsmY
MGQHAFAAFTGLEDASHPADYSPADELIRLEILNAILWDLAVPRDSVKVVVRHGHVTLSGVVDRDYSKECAERDARTMGNVTGVTNDIAVQP